MSNRLCTWVSLVLPLGLLLGAVLVLAAPLASPALAQPADDNAGGPAATPSTDSQADAGPAGSDAAHNASAGAAAQTAELHTIWGLLRASGVIGLIIIVLSVAAVALVVEYLLTIRTRVLMPPGLAENVRELLKTGHVAQAQQQCKLQPSFLAFVLQSGLAEIDGKWAAIEKSMEDATADQAARLYRKIEYLSVIANLAPMLGLLGTVVGLVYAFREVAMTQGAARAADLAEGIYLALVTTVEGLVVAIPALAAFAYFRNRVDQVTAEVAYTALHVFAPFKRAKRSSPAERSA